MHALIGFWILLMMVYQPAMATVIYDITLPTTALIGNAAGPFQLDFQLVDGDGVSNNTIVLTNFQFGTGSPVGLGVGLGGGSGSLATGVSLMDTDFLNTFSAGFDPGATLQFRLQSTTNFAGGTPDQFTFAILDQQGYFLATSYFDVFVSFDIDGASPMLLTGVSPLTGGPTVTLVTLNTVPEPSTVMLVGVGLLVGAALVHQRRKRWGLCHDGGHAESSPVIPAKTGGVAR